MSIWAHCVFSELLHLRWRPITGCAFTPYTASHRVWVLRCRTNVDAKPPLPMRGKWLCVSFPPLCRFGFQSNGREKKTNEHRVACALPYLFAPFCHLTVWRRQFVSYNGLDDQDEVRRRWNVTSSGCVSVRVSWFENKNKFKNKKKRRKIYVSCEPYQCMR